MKNNKKKIGVKCGGGVFFAPSRFKFPMVVGKRLRKKVFPTINL